MRQPCNERQCVFKSGSGGRRHSVKAGDLKLNRRRGNGHFVLHPWHRPQSCYRCEHSKIPGAVPILVAAWCCSAAAVTVWATSRDTMLYQSLRWPEHKVQTVGGTSFHEHRWFTKTQVQMSRIGRRPCSDPKKTSSQQGGERCADQTSQGPMCPFETPTLVWVWV